MNKDYIYDLPKIEVTNGDILKTIFPNIEIKELNNFDEGRKYFVYFGDENPYQTVVFNAEWWNAPYERG